MKKMTLVEKTTLERLHQKKQSMEMFRPEEATMLQLQGHIEQILKSSKLSDDEKIRLLAEAKDKLRRIKDSINPMVVAQAESGEVYFIRKPQPPTDRKPQPSRPRKPSPPTPPPSQASSPSSSGSLSQASSKRSSRIIPRQASLRDEETQADTEDIGVPSMADIEDIGIQARPDAEHIAIQARPEVAHVGTHAKPDIQDKETQSDEEPEFIPLAPPLPRTSIATGPKEKQLSKLLDTMEKDKQIVPDKFSRKFHELRVFLKNNPHILRQNMLGEAVVDGKTIANSNAADLIRNVFIKNEKQKTIGANRFATSLMMEYFSPEMASNSEFISMLNNPQQSPRTSPSSSSSTKTSTASFSINSKQGGKGFPKRKRGGKPLPHPPGKRPRILYLYR